jgi:hypothetical protein
MLTTSRTVERLEGLLQRLPHTNASLQRTRGVKENPAMAAVGISVLPAPSRRVLEYRAHTFTIATAGLALESRCPASYHDKFGCRPFIALGVEGDGFHPSPPLPTADGQYVRMIPTFPSIGCDVAEAPDAQLLRSVRSVAFREADCILLAYSNSLPATDALNEIASNGDELIENAKYGVPIVLLGVGIRTEASVPLADVDAAAAKLRWHFTIGGPSTPNSMTRRGQKISEPAVLDHLQLPWDWAPLPPLEQGDQATDTQHQVWEAENTRFAEAMGPQMEAIVMACVRAHAKTQVAALERARMQRALQRQQNCSACVMIGFIICCWAPYRCITCCECCKEWRQQQQLVRMRKTAAYRSVTCAHCGTPGSGDGATFCRKCGKRYGSQPEPEAAAVRVVHMGAQVVQTMEAPQPPVRATIGIGVADRI